MLGRTIADRDGIEGPPGQVDGLGLLDVATVLGGAKTLTRCKGRALDAPFAGYEIHVGRTEGPDAARLSAVPVALSPPVGEPAPVQAPRP